LPDAIGSLRRVDRALEAERQAHPNEPPIEVNLHGVVGQFLGARLTASPQNLINCIKARKGDCGGGFHATAFDFMVQNGVVLEADSPFIGVRKDCAGQDPAAIKCVAWDYVNSPPELVPTAQTPAAIELMKAALLAHGPIVVAVCATDAFTAYQGGVFDEKDPGALNHEVLLIGWNDATKAWLIKNSWGTDWGEEGLLVNSRSGKDVPGIGGYMWIAWGSNSVGQYAAWIQAPLVVK